MMNKKAIAAFAAGATLLAGFAMATPAFAADGGKGSGTTEVKKPTSYKEAQDAAKAAETALTKAQESQKKADEEAKAAAAAVPAQKPVDATNKVTLEQDATTKRYTVKCVDGATVKAKEDAEKYAKAFNDDLDAKAKAAAAKTAVEEAQKVLDAADAALRNFTAVPDKEDDDYSVALSADATRLQTATKKVKDAFAKANKLYGEWKSAQAKANNAAKTLADFENSHDLTGLNKADRAEHGRLQKAATDAQSKADTLKTKYDDAYSKFNDAFENVYSPAFASYKTDFYLAKDHKEALVLGYRTPEDIELLKTDFQPGVGFTGSSDEVTTPGAPAGQPGAAQPGKPGAPAAGANGAAGKGGAKTEVENKNGKDKRGNTHTGTGVGVTLTALAATMLAGMGAAVRKARH